MGTFLIAYSIMKLDLFEETGGDKTWMIMKIKFSELDGLEQAVLANQIISIQVKVIKCVKFSESLIMAYVISNGIFKLFAIADPTPTFRKYHKILPDYHQ